MFCEILEIFGVTCDIHFLRLPEKTQLLLCEFFKLAILHGIIALHTQGSFGIQKG